MWGIFKLCAFLGESIPIRLFLAGYDLTPTMRDINKKFSVRYYLNLVLIDEEERRYFKQQVAICIYLVSIVSILQMRRMFWPCDHQERRSALCLPGQATGSHNLARYLSIYMLRSTCAVLLRRRCWRQIITESCSEIGSYISQLRGSIYYGRGLYLYKGNLTLVWATKKNNILV